MANIQLILTGLAVVDHIELQDVGRNLIWKFLSFVTFSLFLQLGWPAPACGQNLVPLGSLQELCLPTGGGGGGREEEREK